MSGLSKEVEINQLLIKLMAVAVAAATKEEPKRNKTKQEEEEEKRQFIIAINTAFTLLAITLTDLNRVANALEKIAKNTEN
jgi:hypothetical protein